MANSNFDIQFGIAKVNPSNGDVITLSGTRSSEPVVESINEILDINEQLGEFYPDFCDFHSFYLTPKNVQSCPEKENPVENLPT